MLRVLSQIVACGLGAAIVPAGALACQTALVLALDVSNSIDSDEYRLQTDGLAAALRDPQISEDLIQGQVALSVVQWSGRGEQQVTIAWRIMRSPTDVRAFAAESEAMPRAFFGSNTAVGGVIRFGLSHLNDNPGCQRRVIDISGDGQDNAGTDPKAARLLAERAGVTVNGLAIDGTGRSVTTYFSTHVRTRDGFVLTARGYRDYPKTLRAKIRREIARVLF